MPIPVRGRSGVGEAWGLVTLYYSVLVSKFSVGTIEDEKSPVPVGVVHRYQEKSRPKVRGDLGSDRRVSCRKVWCPAGRLLRAGEKCRLECLLLNPSLVCDDTV